MKTPDELRAAIAAEGGPNYEKGKKQAEKILADMEETGTPGFVSPNYCGVEAQRILKRLGYEVEVVIDDDFAPDSVTVRLPKAAKPKRWWRFWA